MLKNTSSHLIKFLLQNLNELKPLKVLEKQITRLNFAAKINIFKFYINNICRGN